MTPLERPAELGNKLTLTDAEAATIEKAEAARIERAARPSNPDRVAPPVGGDGSTGAAGNVGGYNNFWIDRGDSNNRVDGQIRTSIIIDPPNGRVPALTDEAIRRNAAARRAAPTSDAPESAETREPGAYDNPEQRPLGERCIVGFGSTSGPPSLPVLYNNFKQIVQTKDHVMILVEMNHDARIIPLNKPHAPPHIRKWLGDSVARWERDTLVIDTTNFTDKTRFRGSPTSFMSSSACGGSMPTPSSIASRSMIRRRGRSRGLASTPGWRRSLTIGCTNTPATKRTTRCRAS